jgi:hypothetical protein
MIKIIDKSEKKLAFENHTWYILIPAKKTQVYTVRQANENKLRKKLEKKSLQSWFGNVMI